MFKGIRTWTFSFLRIVFTTFSTWRCKYHPFANIGLQSSRCLNIKIWQIFKLFSIAKLTTINSTYDTIRPIGMVHFVRTLLKQKNGDNQFYELGFACNQWDSWTCSRRGHFSPLGQGKGVNVEFFGGLFLLCSPYVPKGLPMCFLWCAPSSQHFPQECFQLHLNFTPYFLTMHFV